MQLDDLIGKTINRAVMTNDCGELVLFFADGTSVMVDIEHGYEVGDEGLVLEDPDELADYEKVQVGLMTEAEYEGKLQQERMVRKVKETERERRTYEELKRKYEGNQPDRLLP